MKSWCAPLFILLLGPCGAAAQTFVDGERSSYKFVRRTCESPVDAFNELYSEAALKTFDAFGRIYLLDTGGVEGVVGRRGINSRIKIILESDSLHRALTECFGENSEAKKVYVLHLIAANTSALFVGAVAGVGAPLRIPGWIFAAARRTGWSALIKDFVRRGLIEKSTVTSLGLAAGGTVVIAVSAPLVIDANDARLEKKRQMRVEFEAGKKELDDNFYEFLRLGDSVADRRYGQALREEIKALARSLRGNPTATAIEISEIETKLHQIEKDQN